MRIKIIPVSVEFDNFDNDPLFIFSILKIQYGSEYEIECKKNLFKFYINGRSIGVTLFFKEFTIRWGM